ncbi:MAG: cupin domain-containing protein [Anaerolineae bacterium]
MHRVITAAELPPSPWGTVTFEGANYGAEVSMFVMTTAPGNGPDLHVHPYSETWTIRRGRARFTADGEQFEVGPGDIVVAGAGVVHGFKSLGPDPLEIVCVHASPRIIQDWVER